MNELFQLIAIISHVVKENTALRSMGVVGMTELIPVATYLEKILLDDALKLFARKNPQHTYGEYFVCKRRSHINFIIILTYTIHPCRSPGK